MPEVSFVVSELPVADEGAKRVRASEGVASLLRRRVEAMELEDARLIYCKDAHPFAQAAHDAFYGHYPLTIGPDDIWFCIAQGFAHHVNLNAERLRHHFVRHAGKAKLVVDRPDFTLGRPNPWPEVFGAFSEQIAGHVGRPLRDLVVADFSTTTAFHRAATEVALMDAFQPYFEYEMMIGCGIPSVTLRGAPDDWRDVRRRAAGLAKYGLEAWVGALLPILDQIEASSRGHADRAFWRSLFRYQSGSGFASAMTGWIHVLFPYLKDDQGRLVPNRYMKTWEVETRRALAEASLPWMEREGFDGPGLLAIPSGQASAPVRVTDRRGGETHDMRFVAGMFGVAQDPRTLAVSASFGWAVVYDEEIPATEPKRGFWRRRG